MEIFIDEKKFNRQVDRNLLGQELEKAGNTEYAIKLYELNIREEFIGSGPYERLCVIYRKLKRKNDEIRVVKAAIDVLGRENIDRNHFNDTKIEKFKKRLSKLI